MTGPFVQQKTQRHEIRCPVCGKECEELYIRYMKGGVVGCDVCIYSCKAIFSPSTPQDTDDGPFGY